MRMFEFTDKEKEEIVTWCKQKRLNCHHLSPNEKLCGHYGCIVTDAIGICKTDTQFAKEARKFKHNGLQCQLNV